MEFSKFINRYKTKLNDLFNKEGDINELSLSRGMPHDVFQQIMEYKPLSVFIPEEYGGRGAKTHEALALLEASSYESLPLSLKIGRASCRERVESRVGSGSAKDKAG